VNLWTILSTTQIGADYLGEGRSLSAANRESRDTACDFRLARRQSLLRNRRSRIANLAQLLDTGCRV